jgi:hypothetical protein
VGPVPEPLLFFLIVPGIEPGPPDLQPRTLATRPQRRSSCNKSCENSGKLMQAVYPGGKLPLREKTLYISSLPHSPQLLTVRRVSINEVIA